MKNQIQKPRLSFDEKETIISHSLSGVVVNALAWGTRWLASPDHDLHRATMIVFFASLAFTVWCAIDLFRDLACIRERDETTRKLHEELMRRYESGNLMD